MLDNACELAKADVNLLSDELLTKPLLYEGKVLSTGGKKVFLKKEFEAISNKDLF